MLLEDHLTALIEPVVTNAGFELVRIKITGGQTKTLQVMAERPDRTMSANDCAKLSRTLGPVLEDADPMQGAYTLEVSSPGIDRPLVRLKDFEDWQGWCAKLELDRLVEGRKRFKGVLAGLEDGKVAVDLEGEEDTALFPLEWIASAQLILTDDLIRETMRADKKAREEQNDEEQTDQEATGENPMETSQ